MSDILQIRIDHQTKQAATAILEAMGMSMSEAVHLMLRRTVLEKKLPFETRIPNKLTAETLRSVARGEDLHRAEDLNDLFQHMDD